MTQTSNQNSPDPNGEERRSFGRYVADPVDLEVVVGTRRINGTLFDESIGGLGVSVANVDQIAFGQEVKIMLRDVESTGYVRSIRRESATRFRVSISWDDYTEVGGKRRKPVAHFVAHNNLLFVCELLFHDTTPKKTVRLWDGARFQINSTEICSRSFNVRRSELNVQHHILPTLAKLYGLPTTGGVEGLIEKVLDFEFSFFNLDSATAE